MINESVKKTQKLIDGLLEFSKNSFQEVNKQSAKICELVNEVIEELVYRKQDVEITVDLDSKLTEKLDRELTKRVFSNLLLNSIKYRDPDKKVNIAITCEKNDNKIVYSVSDNGIGINPRYREQIFEPLTKLHAENEKYDGIGIGLSLVKSIVEAHGGRIWLDKDY